MSQKKLPSHKSNEDLLKDLNLEDEQISPDVEEKIQSSDTILAFLRFFNIEPGKQEVKAKYLYKLYSKFTEKPLNKLTFSIQMGEYFQFKSGLHDETKVYLVNQKVLNLSEKLLNFLEKQTRHPRHKALSSKAHFESFINKYGLKPGEKQDWIWVSIDLLYNLYDKWVYSIKRKQPMAKDEFERICHAYFIHKDNKRITWFKIHTSILQHVSKDMDTKIKARNSFSNEKEKKQT